MPSLRHLSTWVSRRVRIGSRSRSGRLKRLLSPVTNIQPPLAVTPTRARTSSARALTARHEIPAASNTIPYGCVGLRASTTIPGAGRSERSHTHSVGAVFSSTIVARGAERVTTCSSSAPSRAMPCMRTAGSSRSTSASPRVGISSKRPRTTLTHGEPLAPFDVRSPQVAWLGDLNAILMVSVVLHSRSCCCIYVAPTPPQDQDDAGVGTLRRPPSGG